MQLKLKNVYQVREVAKKGLEKALENVERRANQGACTVVRYFRHCNTGKILIK